MSLRWTSSTLATATATALLGLLLACAETDDFAGPTEIAAMPHGTADAAALTEIAVQFDETDECDDPNNPVEECPYDPPPMGWSHPFDHYFPYDISLYEAPGDPSPDAAGVWLGSSITPANCFTLGGGAIAAGDADRDGLKESCEFALARSFAPMMSFHPSEDCVHAEPYWAAKRFPNGYVNIAYLLSYWRDCGYPGAPTGPTGHWGDSEMVTVMVGFNATTQHWETERAWTSAHWNTSNEHSVWTPASQLDYMFRGRAFPVIYVAENKHANYPEPCADAFLRDWCGGYNMWFWGRVPVISSRNVGSRYVDLVGCVASAELNTSRTECFYQSKPFAGWMPFGSGVTPYRTMMFGDYNFEKFNYNGVVYTTY
jgi:hypothetical protein